MRMMANGERRVWRQLNELAVLVCSGLDSCLGLATIFSTYATSEVAGASLMRSFSLVYRKTCDFYSGEGQRGS